MELSNNFTLQRRLTRVEDTQQCQMPGCEYPSGHDGFISFECDHIFCIPCYKKLKDQWKLLKKAKDRECPACNNEFNMVEVKSLRKSFDELYEEIYKFKKGGMGDASLVRLKGKEENHFFVSKKVKSKSDNAEA